MSHLDWFPLYVDRLVSSPKVRRMDATEFGVYLSLIVEEWKAGGPLPDDDDELAFLGRGDWETVKPILDKCFEKNGNGWTNTTIEEIRAEQESKHERRVEAGRKGGQSKPKGSLSNG